MRNIRITYIICTILLIILLFVVCFPRFESQDISFLKKTLKIPNDVAQYTSYVLIVRGETPYQEVSAPFAYRPLVPVIAALLPIKDPVAALASVGIISLSLVVIALFALFENLGFSIRKSFIGGLIFVVSFPVFMGGSTGIVDPSAILFISLGTLAAVKSKWLWFIAIIFVGTLFKETTAVLVPASLVLLFIEKPRNWGLLASLIILAFAVPFVGIRIAFPIPSSSSWAPSITRLLDNLRFRAIAGILLTVFIPGLLFIVYLFRQKAFTVFSRGNKAFFIGGIIASILLIIFSFFSAHTDYRFAWPFVIFALPLGMAGIGLWEKRLEK